MQPAVSDSPNQKNLASTLPTDPPASTSRDDKRQYKTRNFIVLALYQIVMRMGWIFKTESIIMPAVLDSLGAAGWMRGCLPLLNRFGQSVPPLLMSRRIKVLPQKKWALVCCSALMSVSFLTLALIWGVVDNLAVRWMNLAVWWMPLVFLALYSFFFMSTGVNQLSFGTLQGKLIRTTHRGRLLLVSNTIGAISAITCAALLLPLWLRPGESTFSPLFGFAGACFAASAVTAMLLSETKDNYKQSPNGVVRLFTGAWQTLRGDTNFRRLAIIGALFSASMMLFPHYIKLSPNYNSTRGDFAGLIWWVIIQNAGTALFSLSAGPLADRKGNRLVLRLLMLGICGSPLLAVLLSLLGPTGGNYYFLVFGLIGMTPVCIKTFHNYTLEISEPADHPRYLSTLSLCVGAPMLLSPLVGLLGDLIGFKTVFLGVTLLVLIGWLLTFRLREPRHHITPPPTATITGE